MNKKKNVEKTGLEIAVIGMAGRFPGAKNIEEFWNNLKNGVHSISFLTDEEIKESGIDSQLPENSNYVRCKGGILEEPQYFDAPFFGFTPDEAQVMNPQTRLFLQCTWHALEDAGCNPGSYNGLIGLYAGASSSFQWEARTILSGADDNIGKFAAGILKDKDYLCTRVSYILNLRGPSVTLKTACSTSLVAVDQACRGLLTGVCDIALAGGVSLSAAKKTGYLYEEGMINSPDGYCRAFDAEAAGTVNGEGVGVVVLKRLDEALADRDHIYAVIKGFAINNDGFRKAGFTAPSVDAQAEVIRAARQMAEVEFESVGYIEAHGTGTPLGDPVEIEALKLAFNTDRTQFCAIGSVKTNIGHLDAAAGIAGFIKTVLALKYKEIPASLHFKAPNPKINFENSPFYVNAKLKKWQKSQYPLRAGVSSFGIGGTNAHVILEEAPPAEESSESRPWQLILLSAKTESALNQSAENLKKFLKQHPEIPLPDVCYTLQVRRKAFQYRRILFCHDVQQTLDTLSSPDSENKRTFFAKKENPSVIFMFPGQGSQYVRMGWDLYRTEPYFRKIMDRCFDILTPLMGYNISEVIYPSSVLPGAPAAKNIDQTDLTQPVLFVFEYALAKLLMKWGIKPFAMIGHSIGEYTAARLAGVFSLEDALRLVVLRGKLMQQMPPGAMLSIHLPEEELNSLLKGKEEISLAAVNSSSSCVVSGPTDLINTLKMEFEKKGYECRRLHTSHAFHSKMMLPIINEFKEKVEQVKLKKPGIPYISNVTGNWITVEEVTDPGYWANHLRHTVCFATGINELLKNEDAIFVEVGPGKALSTFVRQHKNKKQTQMIVNLARHPKEEVTDDHYLMKKLGELWLYGKSIEWSEFYKQEKRNRIPFPGYPFEGKCFWIEDELMINGTRMLAPSQFGKKPDLSDWFYYPSWERSLLQPTRNNESMESTGWLIFMDDYRLGTELIEQMQMRPPHLILVRAGDTFTISTQNKTIFTVNPKESKDYDALFTQLRETKRVPQKIIHLWNITGSEKETGLDELDRSQDLGLYSLLNIVQAMGRLDITEKIEIEVVTDNMQEVTGEELICPEKATILGAVKTIPFEYQNIVCRSIDICISPLGSPQQNRLIHNLLSELRAKPPGSVNMVALRGDYRWEQVFKPIRLERAAGESKRFRKEGVYLVTGGLGGIGFACAQHLARSFKARLVLLGRSPFPTRDEWNDWLASHDEGDKVSMKIREIQRLEEQGARIQVISADVASLHQMQEVVAQVKKEFGLINGVIHSAGIIDSAGVIQRRTRDMTQRTIAGKVKGTLVLDYLCKDLGLDFLALFSSLGNQLYGGNFGQVGYNAANEFLEAFASYKNLKHDGFTVTINWTEWLEVGMAVEANRRQQAAKKNTSIPRAFRDCISPSEGVELFNRVMEHSMHRVLVTTNDLSRMMETFNRPSAERSNTLAAGEENISPHRLNQKPGLSKGYAAPQNQIQQHLSEIFQEFFGLEKVGIHDDFFELGGDSLKVVTISSRIHKALDVKIPTQVFFNRSTIAKLSEYIYNTGKIEFSAIMPVEEKEYYPLSSAQKRLFVIQHMDLTSVAYNMPQIMELKGKPDKKKLENAFKKLLRRHESLKTSFLMINEEPVQKVHKEVEFTIEYYQLAKNEIEASKNMKYSRGESKEEELFQNSFIRPFVLSHAPLLRIGLIKSGETREILMVDMHHILCDGISYDILGQDIISLYQGEELHPLSVQYKDYSEWQNSENEKEKIKTQELYWLKQFEREIPVLDIPIDFPRSAMQSFEGSIVDFKIDLEETRALKKLALETGSTLFMVLLAIYSILLSKLSNQEDIIIGTPIAGRINANLEKVIGMFANTLALRNYPYHNITFKYFLQNVKENSLESFENQDYQFEMLIDKLNVKREAGRNPLFDAMFSFQLRNMPITTPGKKLYNLELIPYTFTIRTSHFDILLIGTESGEGIVFSFEYCSKLFKRETMEKFSAYFVNILKEIVKNPEMELSKIDMRSEAEKKQMSEFSKPVYGGHYDFE
jgi:acyl transferase domain-containing protein/acyl carrier protein